MTTMTTATRRAPPAAPRPADAGDFLEILPDPPKNEDKMQQESTVRTARGMFDVHFSSPRTLASGDGYLCWDARDPEGWVYPDCIVAFGVDAAAIIHRNGYVISEVGKPPDFVLEIASKTTGVNDYTRKRRLYKEFRIPESWRFDRTGGQYHDQPIAGDALVNGEYRPIEIVREPSGLLWGRSAVLGLDICWDNGELRLYDPEAGEYIRNQKEERDGRLAAEAQVQAEREARLAAEAQAQAERERNLAAEAEIRRLREMLMRGGRP